MGYSIIYLLLFVCIIGALLFSLIGGRRLSQYGSQAAICVGNQWYPITGPIVAVGYDVRKAEGINLSNVFPDARGIRKVMFRVVYDDHQQCFYLEPAEAQNLTLERAGRNEKIDGRCLLEHEDHITITCGDTEHTVTFQMGG